MANLGFTDGGALNLPTPERARESSKTVWEQPAKFRNSLDRLLRLSFLNSFFGRGGRMRTSDLTLECPDD